VTPAGGRLAVTLVAVLVGLAITGSVSARLGGAARRPAVIRNVVGGACVMAITYGVGLLVGASGAV
jgi:vacuolar iron transporter family protein